MIHRIAIIVCLLMTVTAISLSAMRVTAMPVTASPAAASPAPSINKQFIAICYHDIQDDNPDQVMDGVSTKKLAEQLNWLKTEGYVAVSVDDIIAARDGRKGLPDKAVFLSFDDGYTSFYTRVFPLLQLFNFPAVLGVVDAWMGGQPGGHGGHGGDRVVYGDTTMPREAFVTWEEIRNMEKTGLVEIVSHSHDLHHGIPANPQGNSEPAAVTMQYDAASKTYETAAHYEKRLADDAALSVKTILEHTGHRPRMMIWPYGAFNPLAVKIANDHGMPITLTLEDGMASADHLETVPRYLVKDDPDLSSFVADIRAMTMPITPVRVIQVDLDYVYDPDPLQQNRNLSSLIDRIYKLGINTVFLQAFADPTGDGFARQLYFPNRHLPLRADLLNRVAWQIKERTHARVYGWLPVLSFDLGENTPPVMAWDPDTHKSLPNKNSYRRVSPFDAAARTKIMEIYEDMARMTPIDGILFHDDALLSDFEDAGPAALDVYRQNGLPGSVAAIREDPIAMKKWAVLKTNTLLDFTKELTARVSQYRAPLLTVRDIYAPVVLDPQSKEWFAQDYDRFLEVYDYTAIMAMPRMENVPDADTDAWLKSLVSTAAGRPNGLKRTIFELQTVDWRKPGDGPDRQISTETLGREMRLLARNGALNFGYYPDDFIKDLPNADALHKDFSLQSYPYLP